MTLYEFLEATKSDYDVCDTEYYALVTVCYGYGESDDYNKFCGEIIKKVDFVSQINNITLTANWSGMIEKNLDKFRAFTKEHWRDDCQYEDDDDELVYQWIIEIDRYMAGFVSEDFYTDLLALAKTLE